MSTTFSDRPGVALACVHRDIARSCSPCKGLYIRAACLSDQSRKVSSDNLQLSRQNSQEEGRGPLSAERSNRLRSHLWRLPPLLRSHIPRASTDAIATSGAIANARFAPERVRARHRLIRSRIFNERRNVHPLKARRPRCSSILLHLRMRLGQSGACVIGAVIAQRAGHRRRPEVLRAPRNA